MHYFWETVLRPLLRARQPECIIEIGSGEGETTKLLLQHCLATDCHLHTIDNVLFPAMKELDLLQSSLLHIHTADSLSELPHLPAADVVFIDGDHNWYTVYNELLLLQKLATIHVKPFPIVIFHDTEWPYGRRDMYYNPNTVPPTYRHPYVLGGLVPGIQEPQHHEGLNPNYCHAKHEGGAQNGVRTAIEDFVEISSTPLQFVTIPGMHGLGILLSKEHTRSHPSLIALHDQWNAFHHFSSYIQTYETNRISFGQDQHKADQKLLQLEQQHLGTIHENLQVQREAEQRIIQQTIKLNEQECRIQNLKAISSSMKNAKTAMENTKSWRWTLPIRVLESWLRRLHKRIRSFFSRSTNVPFLTKQCLSPNMILSQEERQKSIEKSKMLTSKITFSLIVPVEDIDEILFRRTLNSIVEQTYENWQLVIVNLNSQNNIVQQIAESYMSHYPDNFSIIDQTENVDLTHALNSAFSECRGEYIGIVHANDTLELDALECLAAQCQNDVDRPDILYTDHDELVQTSQIHTPHLKPSWSPELLLETDYIKHFFVITHSLFDSIEGLHPEANNVELYDLLLRATEKADSIIHIPRILYHQNTNTVKDTEILPDIQHAVERSLERKGVSENVSVEISSVMQQAHPFVSLNFMKSNNPLVSIIIPTKNNSDLLSTCLHGIQQRTDYENYEVIVVDNGSTTKEAVSHLANISEKVIRIETGKFNFSTLNNRAAEHAKGELFLLLNDDTEPLDSEWLRQLVGVMSLDPRIGVVGPKLVYPHSINGKEVQHAGMVLGRHTASLVQFKYRKDLGYANYNQVMRNCSAVSGAALLTRKDIFTELDGLNEKDLAVDYSDVDYCLRVQELGFRTVFTPHSVLVHHESATRGNNNGKGATLNNVETLYMQERWKELIEHDPYYHPAFTRNPHEFAFTIV